MRNESTRVNGFRSFTCLRNPNTGALRIPEWAAAGSIFTKEDCDTGACEGRREKSGLWDHITGFRAITIAKSCDGDVAEVHGERTLCHLHPDGANMKGSLSVGGIYHMGITTTEIFELPDGRQVIADVIQILHRAGQKDLTPVTTTVS